jgi:hypothetical protein
LNLSVQVTSAITGTVYTASQSLPMTVTLTPAAQTEVQVFTFNPAAQGSNEALDSLDRDDTVDKSVAEP